MDSKSFVLLEHLYDQCGDTPFVILDADEACPSTLTREDLPALVDTLSGDGYIQLKYADEGEYCLGVTAQGKSLVHSVREERERRRAADLEVKREEEARQEAERLARRARREKEQLDAQVAAMRQALTDANIEPPVLEAPPVEDDADEDKPLPISPDEIETSHVAPAPATVGGKTVLYVWLAAFLGALLGGGIVGLVMYVLHVTLH